MSRRKSRNPPKKPAGYKAAMGIGPDGITLHPVVFPDGKREREQMIADLFAANMDDRYPNDPLRPFSNPVGNGENDLDFTITIGTGEERQLELTEFAPLQYFQGRYENAPNQFRTGDVARMLLELIRKKSLRQGGSRHLLLVYPTDTVFTVPPPCQELVRRVLTRDPPRFERIYFLSAHPNGGATISTIYPNVPHDWFAQMPDEALAGLTVSLLNPRELLKTQTERSGS